MRGESLPASPRVLIPLLFALCNAHRVRNRRIQRDSRVRRRTTKPLRAAVRFFSRGPLLNVKDTCAPEMACQNPLSKGCRQRKTPENRGYRRSEEHTSELQSLRHLVCRLLLEKKKQ